MNKSFFMGVGFCCVVVLAVAGGYFLRAAPSTTPAAAASAAPVNQPEPDRPTASPVARSVAPKPPPPPPPPPPPKSVTFDRQISADGDWQPVGVSVSAGDQVTVEYVGGTWTTRNKFPSTDRFPPTNPQPATNPTSSPYRRMDPSTLGSMLMRIDGTSGAWEVITSGVSRRSVQADGTGQLEFTMNDTAQSDNAGTVSIKVTVKESS